MKNDKAAEPAAPAANPHFDSAAMDALAGEAVQLSPGEGIQVEPQKPPAIPTDKLCVMLLGPVFAIFAPNWAVTSSEVDQLGTAYGGVIDKYFPDGLGDYGPEITAVLVTAMIVAPRAGKPAKLPAKTDKKPAADAPAQ